MYHVVEEALYDSGPAQLSCKKWVVQRTMIKWEQIPKTRGTGILTMWWTLPMPPFATGIPREGLEVQDYLVLILGLIFGIVILTGCIDCFEHYRLRRREDYLDDATMARNIDTTNAEHGEAPPPANADIHIPRREDDASSQSSSDSFERKMAALRSFGPPRSKPIPIPPRRQGDQSTDYRVVDKDN